MKDLKDLFDEKLMISLMRFEKKSGITRQTVYNVLCGRTKPTKFTIKKICAYFCVDYKDYI